jgi:hypothetical protein
VFSADDDALVTMRDTPGTWLMRNPILGTLNDDYDGDGQTNFYEWALVLDPAASNGEDGSIVEIVNGHLTLRYQRQKNSPFVNYIVQATSDPASWNNPLPGDITETILADDGLIQTVLATDNTPISANIRRFMRLRLDPVQ